MKENLKMRTIFVQNFEAMLSTKTKVDDRWLGTPSWSTATNKLLSLVGEIGMKAVASLYPNDFDYYMCALELTTSDKGTIDYLAQKPVFSYNLKGNKKSK